MKASGDMSMYPIDAPAVNPFPAQLDNERLSEQLSYLLGCATVEASIGVLTDLRETLDEFIARRYVHTGGNHGPSIPVGTPVVVSECGEERFGTVADVRFGSPGMIAVTFGSSSIPTAYEDRLVKPLGETAA